LRLDNDLLSSRALEAVLQQTVPRQSADQGTEFFLDASPLGRKQAEWQTGAQRLRATGRCRAEFSQGKRMAVEPGGNFPLGVRRERDLPHEPGG
jgi:hypothetical protein